MAAGITFSRPIPQETMANDIGYGAGLVAAGITLFVTAILFQRSALTALWQTAVAGVATGATAWCVTAGVERILEAKAVKEMLVDNDLLSSKE